MSAEPLDATVRVGDHRLRVQVRGTGRPVLLLNGVGAPLELWAPLLHRLTGVRTIAVDTPGSGGSPAPEMPLSVRGHARLALGVLDRLGFGEVSVLGFSFGGMVAQEMARLAGGRVQRLVLASTCCGWGGVPGSPEALLGLTTPHRYYARRFVAERPPYPADDGGVAFRSVPLRRPDAPPPEHHGHLYQFWAAATWSSLPWLWQLEQPALVITGDRDPLIPAVNAQILATMLPSAHLHIVHGGDHMCLLDRAESVAPILEGFLAP